MTGFTIDAASGEPPFEQVRRQIAAQAADGTLAAGHRLPTVRRLADDLGLAVNTVAKAYRALEADGVVETHGRRGTLIASGVPVDDAARVAAEHYALTARRHGVSRDQAIRLVEDAWTS